MTDNELRQWVDSWSSEYPDEYDEQIEHLRGRDAFTYGELAEVYKWKYRGLWPQRKIDSMDAFPEAEALTRRAFACPDELGALLILTLIPGASTAGASAILMAHNPGQFTVMDIRAIKSLIWPLERWSAQKQGTKASALRWPEYLEQCRDIAARTNRSLRIVDRALYASKGRA